MALYQASVLKKYLKQLDTTKLNKAYKKYSKYFLNSTIQENIRNSKEEEYQGIFLTELFVNVLDYTLKPKADFNLVAEYKNQTNARKADGAILSNDVAVGVIELKGTNTKDLESIRKQAFDYKANQKGCVYVITSNFEKLRFYINDATEFEEFNLFELTEEQFALFYLCLQKDNVLNNVPLKIKEASVVEEEQITKQFYKDYSLFKRELFRDLVKRNAKRLKNLQNSTELSDNLDDEVKAELLRLEKNVKLTLFQKSQKLIDRYLFVFFAEDRGLLPPNSTLQILDKWKADVDFGDDRPLYAMFKQYFKFLDKGRQGTKARAEIYAYNGGLFKEDTVLDSLEIDNDLLYNHTKKLAAYDFESQVDVNILGHIFENSLNEIESVNAEIEGSDFDKQKSKRKKDGVFYTPKYITKYIVENTIGKLCDEKKTALEFKEEEYFKGRKNRNKSTIEKLVATLDEYREWLLQLTICDPACGSGAFLNQALDFLIKEHTYIDELKAKVLGGGIVFSDIENTILENNIYGVDLNEESVEIAKLSLWLRTAQPRRKLNNLNSNIKCGNSLIDSKTVAGDKAFNWQEQFPKVFDKGGFDVIIGNPPYVRQELFKEIKPYLEENYKCYNSIADLYTYFIEKGIKLMNETGVFSFILPNKFLKTSYGKGIRKVISDETYIQLIYDFDDYPVFADATTYPLIFILNKNSNRTKFIYSEINKRANTDSPIDELLNKEKTINYSNLEDDKWSFASVDATNIINKIKQNSIRLEELVNGKVLYGIKTGCNDAFIIDNDDYKNLNSSNIFKVVAGREVKRYTLDYDDKYMIYNDWYFDLDTDIKLKKFLSRKKEVLENRAEVKQNKYPWWSLSRYGSNNAELLFKSKIIYPRINSECNFYFDEKGEHLITDNNFYISTDKKYLLPILNSKLIFYFITQNAPTLQGGYYDFRRDYVIDVPIKKLDDISINKLSNEVDLMQKIGKANQDVIAKFRKYLISQFSIEKLPKKLQNWHELEFGEFTKEVNKAIKKENKERVKNEQTPIATLTKLDEMDWMDVFETKKAEAQALQQQINQTDKEIDAMVYELYGLTDDEIAIVEKS